MPQAKQPSNQPISFQPDLEALLKVSPSIILVFDPKGKILAANNAAANLIGYPIDQLVGKNIFRTFKSTRALLKTQVLQVAESKDASSFEDIYQGRTLSCNLYPILNNGEGVNRFALLAQDNTDWRHAEQQAHTLSQELEHRVLDLTIELGTANRKLHQEKKHAELQAGFFRVLAEYAYNYGELIQHISDEIAQQIGDACVIGIFSEGGVELQKASVSHRSPAVLEKLRLALKNNSYPIQHVALGSIVLKKEIFNGEQLTYDQACDLIPPTVWPIIDKAGLIGLAGIPLLVDDRVLGGIFIARNSQGSQPYSSEEIAFLQYIASPISLTIDNARLFDEIKQNRLELRGLLQQTVKSQEEQFQRLGKEIHDHIGQDLTAININLSLIETMLPANIPEGLTPRLADANRLVEESVARMRNIMSDFLPPMLDRYGLAAALLWYTQKLTKRTNIPIIVNDYNLHDVRLPRQVELGLFRIAQEALNNVAKHTRASRAEIDLKDEDGYIIMTITDTGVGFDPLAVSVDQNEHWGLALMRERAREMDASFSIKSEPGIGTKILLRVLREQ